MEPLTSAQRRAFRARAHALHPVVSIGQNGLTPAVLHEIDVALLAHELIKIRVFSNVRDERAALLARICAELAAAPVQHLGKVLIIWRQAQEAESPEQPAQQRRQTGTRVRSPATSRTAPPAPGPRTRRQGMPAGNAGAPRPRTSNSRSDASARRRRPSDVIAAGAAPGKRRAVTAGKAQDTRKRAPATTKGPFEPGKRSGVATAARRRRRQT